MSYYTNRLTPNRQHTLHMLERVSHNFFLYWREQTIRPIPNTSYVKIYKSPKPAKCAQHMARYTLDKSLQNPCLRTPSLLVTPWVIAIVCRELLSYHSSKIENLQQQHVHESTYHPPKGHRPIHIHPNKWQDTTQIELINPLTSRRTHGCLVGNRWRWNKSA